MPSLPVYNAQIDLKSLQILQWMSTSLNATEYPRFLVCLQLLQGLRRHNFELIVEKGVVTDYFCFSLKLSKRRQAITKSGEKCSAWNTSTRPSTTHQRTATTCMSTYIEFLAAASGSQKSFRSCSGSVYLDSICRLCSTILGP